MSLTVRAAAGREIALVRRHLPRPLSARPVSRIFGAGAAALLFIAAPQAQSSDFTLAEAVAFGKGFATEINRLNLSYYYADNGQRDAIRQEIVGFLMDKADIVYLGRLSILRYARQLSLSQRQRYVNYFQTQFFPNLMARFKVLPVGFIEFVEVQPLLGRKSPTFNVIFDFYRFAEPVDTPSPDPTQLPPLLDPKTVIAQIRYSNKTKVAEFIDLSYANISLSTLLSDSVTARIEEMGIDTFVENFLSGQVDLIDISSG